MTRARRGFSLLEAIVGVAIATAFLGAIAMFTMNLGDSRARLARMTREVECADAIFNAMDRACATAVVDGRNLGPGVAGNESSVRIVHCAVALGGQGQPAFSDLVDAAISFDAGGKRVSVAHGGQTDILGAPIRNMRVRYLGVDGWKDAYDSVASAAFPVGVQVSIWFDHTRDGSGEQSPATAAAPDDETTPSRTPRLDPPDRTRFFRITGGPRADPLAVRGMRDEPRTDSREGATR
jgi:hypothetical protein